MASRWPENAPMVIGEARSVGCPIIAPKSVGFLKSLKMVEMGFYILQAMLMNYPMHYYVFTKANVFRVSPPPIRETQYEKLKRSMRSCVDKTKSDVEYYWFHMDGL